MTPEERRDTAVAQIIAAGGSVTEISALAYPDEPGVVVAYELKILAQSSEQLASLHSIRGETEVDLSGLVPYEPSPAGQELVD